METGEGWSVPLVMDTGVTRPSGKGMLLTLSVGTMPRSPSASNFAYQPERKSGAWLRGLYDSPISPWYHAPGYMKRSSPAKRIVAMVRSMVSPSDFGVEWQPGTEKSQPMAGSSK